MLDDKSVVAALAKVYSDMGTATQQAVIVCKNLKGNFRGAWVVWITDRTNIANTMQDLAAWSDTEEPTFDLSHINSKREQFGLPEITEDTIQDPDRDPQPKFSKEEMEKFMEAPFIFPTEEDARNRV